MILISNQYGWISINAKDFEGVCDKVSSFGVTEVKRIENQCYDIIFLLHFCVFRFLMKENIRHYIGIAILNYKVVIFKWVTRKVYVCERREEKDNEYKDTDKIVAVLCLKVVNYKDGPYLFLLVCY